MKRHVMRASLAGLAVMTAGCDRERASARDGAAIHFGAAGAWGQPAGEMAEHGIRLAMEELNAQPGVAQIEIDFQNDSGKGATAARVAERFVDSTKVAAVIGHLTSGAMKAAAKVYDGRLAAVATAASSPELTGISPWAFRVIASDSASGIDIARFASKQGKRRVAILYENSAYGRGLADAFQRSFRGVVLGVDPISDASEQDFAPFVDWFKARKPDLVFVAGTDRSGIAFLKQARRLGLDVELMGGVGWRGVAADTANAEGVWVGVPFSAEDQRPEVQRFVKAFRKRWNSTPDAGAALAYDATKVLATAARKVGTDRARIRDWLAQTREAGAVPGVTGEIRFGEDGDPIGKRSVMTRVRAGALVVQGN